jgi:hypothetical protein
MPVAGYKFERTLLQQSAEQAPNQQAVEAMAEAALNKVGLRRDDAKAGYSMLVTARVRQDWRAPNAWPYGLGRIHIGIGTSVGRVRGGFGSIGMGFPVNESPSYVREVSLLMRDLSTSQVVFESSAINDGLWSDDNNILPILFEAAVSGFPTPPAGVRRVNITLPPKP